MKLRALTSLAITISMFFAVLLCVQFPALADWKCDCCGVKFPVNPGHSEYEDNWIRLHEAACCRDESGGNQLPSQPLGTTQEEQLADEANERGRVLFADGNFQGAIESFEEALSFLPDNATFQKNLGLARNALIKRQRQVEAERQLKLRLKRQKLSEEQQRKALAEWLDRMRRTLAYERDASEIQLRRARQVAREQAADEIIARMTADVSASRHEGGLDIKLGWAWFQANQADLEAKVGDPVKPFDTKSLLNPETAQTERPASSLLDFGPKWDKTRVPAASAKEWNELKVKRETLLLERKKLVEGLGQIGAVPSKTADLKGEIQEKSEEIRKTEDKLITISLSAPKKR